MGLRTDLGILYHLLRPRAASADAAARLEAFYERQADAYDAFRRRLLHGREDLMSWLEVPAGGRLLDMGGGTGSNLECLGPRLDQLGSAEVVDLCPALLKVAQDRIRRQGWPNVTTVLADATTYQPEGPADVITFSYSLSMIPDWFKAIDRAYDLLRPGGQIGVADFYISRKWPPPGLRKHGRLQRLFWPLWFSWDNVFLSPDCLPYLLSRFATVRLEERLGRAPYLLGLQMPYYLFVGRKPV
jgi:S-adenosylmethionine-diacylgycerolhomoserine-N-methlytransferase